MNQYSEKSVAIFIPEKNFHDLEYSTTKTILENNGIKVFIASENKNLSFGQYGLRVKPDVYLFNLHPENFKALILIGGTGTRNYLNNQILLKTIKNFHQKGKIIAAICSAVGILAVSELLNGRKVTCYPSDLDLIKSYGAIVTNNPIEIDNKIITASGPEAAEIFGRTISEIITTKKG